jgi:hypothetical protein
MIDDTQEGMTPQQVRLFHLQASRNWGPFTDTESVHLNATFKRQKSRPSDVQRVDFSSLIVVREIVEEGLPIMFAHAPEMQAAHQAKRIKDPSTYGRGDSTFVKQPVYESPYGITSADLTMANGKPVTNDGDIYEGEYLK